MSSIAEDVKLIEKEAYDKLIVYRIYKGCIAEINWHGFVTLDDNTISSAISVTTLLHPLSKGFKSLSELVVGFVVRGNLVVSTSNGLITLDKNLTSFENEDLQVKSCSSVIPTHQLPLGHQEITYVHP